MNQPIKDAAPGKRCAVELIRKGGGWPDEGQAFDRLITEAAALAVDAGAGHGEPHGGCREGGRPDIASGDGRLHINVMLSSDEMIQGLNHQFRGLDKATNVLSFPYGQSDPANPEEAGLLGDVILAYETVERERLARGIPLAHHAVHLVVHGTLHLFGFDHGNDDEADEMEKIEISVLSQLNIPNPYAGLESGPVNSDETSQLMPGE